MLHSINIKNFKCFKNITLEIPALTVLTGFNAAGKSTAMQALALLHQDACEAPYSQYLSLNGQMLQLGSATDVLNKQHAKDNFSIILEMENGKNLFVFEYNSGEEYFRKSYFENTNQVQTWDLNSFNMECADLLKSSTYLSADRLGPRETYSMEFSSLYSSVGAKGERTIRVLYEYSDYTVNNILRIQDVQPQLPRQVIAYMQKLFPGFKMDIQPIDRTNFATLGLTVNDSVGYVRSQNIGFGLSSTLSVITAGLFTEPGEVLMVENPEIHLHPRGQSFMGQFFARVASTGSQAIIETHSDHVLNGIRKAVKNKILAPENVAIYFFNDLSSDGEPNIERVSLNSDGSVDSWPDGFFDQYDKDLDELIDWKE